jgi:hypothetical protein
MYFHAHTDTLSYKHTLIVHLQTNSFTLIHTDKVIHLFMHIHKHAHTYTHTNRCIHCNITYTGLPQTENALTMACQGGKAEIVEHLIDLGKKFYLIDLLYYIIFYFDEFLYDYFIDL